MSVGGEVHVELQDVNPSLSEAFLEAYECVFGSEVLASPVSYVHRLRRPILWYLSSCADLAGIVGICFGSQEVRHLIPALIIVAFLSYFSLPVIFDVLFLLLGQVPLRRCIFAIESEEGPCEIYVVLVLFLVLLVPFVFQEI